MIRVRSVTPRLVTPRCLPRRGKAGAQKCIPERRAEIPPREKAATWLATLLKYIGLVVRHAPRSVCAATFVGSEFALRLESGAAATIHVVEGKQKLHRPEGDILTPPQP